MRRYTLWRKQQAAPEDTGRFRLIKKIHDRWRDIEAAPNTLITRSKRRTLGVTDPVSAGVAAGPPKRRRTDQAQVLMHQREW